MSKFFIVLVTFFASLIATAQTPKTYTSSEILLQTKKLDVLGSVLYIAAHPDDENTRLLAYLANEKLYRTGYLSLTRGDGGQNLIGDEQGIDLGLIRTQELLAARRIDGAEQFFSRAYDFGFSKTSAEAMATWGHDKILSDVVWVIRKFRPDVIITRFPEDTRAGHGHHAASAILAREAFDAAADSTKFPEQFAQGVTVWQAKRILWNTFNFGNTNTQSESQFKLDVGMYNPSLGKGYGEIAALSRSQHKSQGFGVPAQRGTAIEYFSTIKGEPPVKDLMDGVDVTWNRLEEKEMVQQISSYINEMIELTALGEINQAVLQLKTKQKSLLVETYHFISEKLKDSYWKTQKLKEIQQVIENQYGLFLEATANTQYAVQGDSLRISATANNRLGKEIRNIRVRFNGATYTVGDTAAKNTNLVFSKSVFIDTSAKLTQPYWLANPMEKGSFNVNEQQLIGKAENDPLSADFIVNIYGTDFTFSKPIRYKYTDPVKGEIYQPVSIVPAFSVRYDRDFSIGNPTFEGTVESYKNGNKISLNLLGRDGAMANSASFTLNKNERRRVQLGEIKIDPLLDANGNYPSGQQFIKSTLNYGQANGQPLVDIKRINYDHIPTITYFHEPGYYVLNFNSLQAKGKNIGYIAGAGDKVPQALQQMGYHVTMLKQPDITTINLKQFDAVVTGVRAYNINEWMNNVYDELMAYVKDGGVLVTQYNTSNQIGPVKAKIAPYPFNISRNRITDETAAVNFLLPEHPVLNYPNKITAKDFEGWIQERSIYNADNIDSNYQRILSMKDPGEADAQDGSLIVANYGKGKFVYTGLVFFRELPAGVPGAYRLFANIIAPPGVAAPPSKASTTKKSALKGKKLN